MTLKGSVAATATLERPALWGIGRYAVGETAHQFPIDHADLERDTVWATDVLREYGVERGRRVHLVSGGWESPWYSPFFAATLRLGATYTIGDIFGFDARRTDLFVRRLPPQVLIGISADVVAGLADADALGNLRAVPHILARADAAADLRAAGIGTGLVVPIGPAMAVTRIGREELSYDTAEWSITSTAGELRVSTVGGRAHRVSDAPTGVRGEVVGAGLVRLG